ncbi:5'-methylthioadenosine phosphorylase [Sulfodiicoccus acidiphilus]|uniref:5'-methylthioadenosine phosphorylase n=1 Tax=Sulfodiicoccus acidiphilus TaxID=1670455 RepID=A0A348B0Y3_9CREN|nr:purine-nucleoside phosphorylase [Sulfodiicoccus acidiphilus]BBD71835.1 5'-methylthioadenosine phosphorylase [Sulfodiicoccus acidiphilus]GGU02360.1 5'-methylthioadenosine phosphorylase [Sulfodiicoccus acidiphilus]
MNPVHILARREDVAPVALIAGDPGRVKKVATLLSEARIVNENRGFLTFTGYYNGSRVTVATHGIGGPSLAIVVEELYMLGVKTFVRLGTAGSLVEHLKVGDVIVATGASYLHGGTIGQYVGNSASISTSPEPILTSKIMKKLSDRGVQFAQGSVFSSDAFYAEDSSFVSRWASLGNIGVEMECATLFALGNMRGLKTAGILVVSDELTGEKRWIDRSTLENRVDQVARAILEVLAEEE